MTMLALGIIIGWIVGMASLVSYKKVLVMKSKDGTAEKIGKHYYFINKEGDGI